MPKARVDFHLIFAAVEEPKSRTSPDEQIREKAEEFRKGGLAQQSVKQHRFDAGLTQDRSNQLSVPVESDGLPNHALNVVGHERAEQPVDLVVRQLGEETTNTARDPKMRAELRLPPSLIDVEAPRLSRSSRKAPNAPIDKCEGAAY